MINIVINFQIIMTQKNHYKNSVALMKNKKKKNQSRMVFNKSNKGNFQLRRGSFSICIHSFPTGHQERVLKDSDPFREVNAHLLRLVVPHLLITRLSHILIVVHATINKLAKLKRGRRLLQNQSIRCKMMYLNHYKIKFNISKGQKMIWKLQYYAKKQERHATTQVKFAIRVILLKIIMIIIIPNQSVIRDNHRLRIQNNNRVLQYLSQDLHLLNNQCPLLQSHQPLKQQIKYNLHRNKIIIILLISHQIVKILQILQLINQQARQDKQSQIIFQLQLL